MYKLVTGGIGAGGIIGNGPGWPIMPGGPDGSQPGGTNGDGGVGDGTPP
jgi:hypothetical protein